MAVSVAVSEGAERREDVSGLTSQIVSTASDLRGLRVEWDALHTASGATTPFNSWPWVYHWWQAFGRSNGWRRDSLRIVVQRDAAGAARAIFPLVLTSLGLGPLSLRKLRPCGSVRLRHITEIPSPLVWPGFEGQSTEELLRTLHSQSAMFHWCDLLIPTGGALGQRFRECAPGASAIWGKLITNYVLSLPATWEALRTRLRRNIKESLRHCYNSLAREGLQWRFEVVDDPDRVVSAVSDFMRLHRARARWNKGPVHLDHFPRETHRRFLLGVMAELMAGGAARVCELRIGGTLAASRIMFTYGDSVYLYYSGFDPRWARHSVSTLVTAECIKWAIDRGARQVSLSLGRDVSKTRWDPDPHELSWLRIPGGALAGVLLRRLNAS